MPYAIPTIEAIRTGLLRDIQNLLPEASVDEDSDHYIRASAVASALEGLYRFQQYMARQVFPDTADSSELERHAHLRGLARKAATRAGGTILFSGAPGSEIPAGTQIKTADGRAYRTTMGGTVGGGGTVSVASQAVFAGGSGNTLPDTPATLVSAPPGVSGSAEIETMTGGADAESDSDLLARLLALLRKPPAGGAVHDYEAWALEVPGVASAYVYPLRRGIGTVDVVVTADDGVPAPEVIAAVQTNIDLKRPVTALGSLTIAPTVITVNVAAAVSVAGTTVAAVQASLTGTMETYFSRLRPGQTLLKSQIEALVSAAPGVQDRAVSSPTGNVVPVVDEAQVEWVRLGTVTVTAL